MLIAMRNDGIFRLERIIKKNKDVLKGVCQAVSYTHLDVYKRQTLVKT